LSKQHQTQWSKYMCSNIPASSSYGVYISQLIRYARVSSNYSDFLKRHLHLRNRLLDQGYTKIRLIRNSTKLSEVNVKDTLTSHIDKQIFLTFCWLLYENPSFIIFSCTKSGSLRFSQFSGCWLIFSVYILWLLTFPL
jgi:hypothetical protein